jgi:DNA polymerase-4
VPAPERASRILQVDADAFFVQVARLEDPHGVGAHPLLLVGGSPRGRGVVTSASYEARAFGVRSGMPTAQALRLCPAATVVGVSRRACSERSRRMVEVLESFTPMVEPSSIDEMYLDLSGTEGIHAGASLEDLARRVRSEIRRETAIAVSVGGGTNRLVAKLAAGRAKPHRAPELDGVLVVPAGGEAMFLEQFALAEIPGIGPRFQQRLARHDLIAVLDALRVSQATLTEWLGARAARWLYQRIRGIDGTPVRRRERAKSLSRDTTFATDIGDDRELGRHLLRLLDRAAADLRRHHLTARTITVKIRDRDFTTRQKSRTLARSIVAERVLGVVAQSLLEALRRDRRIPARLLGVALSGLEPADAADQLDLFQDDEASEETARDRVVARAIDQVRMKFGDQAVTRGGALPAKHPRKPGR